ncbi:MAG: cation diffusion facilitator family transporter [Nitrospirota bacterium]
MTNSLSDRNKAVQKVLLVTLGVNLLFWSVKFLWGYWTGAISMQADSIHALLDTCSSFVGLIGVLLASRPPDANHPDGHGKFETIAAIGIAILIFIGCFEIMMHSIKRFQTPVMPKITLISFVIMGASLFANVMLSRWEGRMGGVLKSEVLLADALHTKSDVYATGLVMVSMLAVSAGYPLMDPLAALAICVVIGAAGAQILMNGVKALKKGKESDGNLN